MPTDRTRLTVAGVELLILLLCGPFLLFPYLQPLITSLAMVLLVAGWLLCWKTYAFPVVSTPLNGVLLAFAVTVLMGALVSADDDLTLSKTTGLILGLATWRYLIYYVDSERRLWLAAFAYCCVGLGIIAVGLLSANWSFRVAFVERIFRVLPPQLINLPGGADAGVQTNQLAGTILFYLFLPLTFLWNFRRFSLKIPILFGAGIAGLLLFTLLLLTQSRSAWIGAVAGCLILPLAYGLLAPPASAARRFGLAIFLLGSIAGTILIFAAWPVLVAAYGEQAPTSTPVGTLESLSFRYEVWRWAIEAVKDFPITGTGLGAFRRVVLRLYPTPFTMDFAHAHNVFLQVALDVGLPGLIAYLSTLLLSLFAAWRAALVNLRMRPLALGLVAGLVAFHVYGLTDVLALGSKTAIAFWIVLGLIGALWNLENRKQYARLTHNPSNPLQARRRLLPAPGPF